MDQTAILTILGLVTAAVLFASNRNVVEGFMGIPQRTMRVDRVIKDVGTDASGFVTIPGNYQAMLSPRGGAGNVDYGALVRYNMPDQGKLATNPYLTYEETAMRAARNGGGNGGGRGGAQISNKNTVRGMPAASITTEGYSGPSAAGCSGAPRTCAPCAGAYGEGIANGEMIGGQGAVAASRSAAGQRAPGFAANNYSQQLASIPRGAQITDELPVSQSAAGGVQSAGGGAQSSGGTDALGQPVTQPIIYDRFIYANQRSRLRNNGACLIRGDLPIVPIRSEWFRPSVHPQIDLCSGSLAVIGGDDNSTQRELLALRNAASGGLLDVGGGVNYSVQKSAFGSSAGGDVSYTSFP